MSREGSRLWSRLGYDTRILLLSVLAGMPGLLFSLGVLWLGDFTPKVQWTVSVLLLGAWGGVTVALRDRVVRPLQTLSNMLAALREGDFSIRARVPTPGNDPLTLAYMEVNALEEILREQRLGAVEATATLQTVLTEIDLAIFAFDHEQRLSFLNRAGRRLLRKKEAQAIGRTAEELRLLDALMGVAPRTIEINLPGGSGRWEVRRTRVRQEGLPLDLLVLSDLSRALREEEREAWKRLVRVLSHEINNSLAPIKSIAGSLRNMVTKTPPPPDVVEDVGRGLDVISGRAEALGRFMASYAQLARLPQPALAPLAVREWVQRVASLETRLEVRVLTGPDLEIQADGDQLDQLLINLIRNAVDATLEQGGGVQVGWQVSNGHVRVMVDDEGTGIGDTANLFVPFFTTKQGGTGIGLVLCRQIADGHGGDLELRNRPDGVGARAVLTLPMGEGQGSPPGEPPGRLP